MEPCRATVPGCRPSWIRQATRLPYKETRDLSFSAAPFRLITRDLFGNDECSLRLPQANSKNFTFLSTDSAKSDEIAIRRKIPPIMIRKIALGLLSLGAALTIQAANTAFDKASNSPYADGWQSGDNGGTGFGAWVLTKTSLDGGANGVFTGSSSGNAGGSGNIDTAGLSWGMYANSGQTVSAVRPLSGGSLLVGQTITLSIDNGFVQNGGTEGFGLQTSGGTNRIEFYFVGGASDYTLSDGTGSHDSLIGFTGNGLALAFTLTAANSYSLAVTPNGGSTSIFSGSLEGSTGLDISQLRFFNANGGNGAQYDFYANLLTVPEVSPAWSFGAPAILGALFFARRRRAKA